MDIRYLSQRLLFLVVISFQIAPVGIILFTSLNVSQWTDHAGWVTDKTTQCRYYTSRNFENRDITWDGPCQEGLVHGTGRLTIFEGKLPILQFDGSMVEGRIQGYGRLVYLSDGDVYEGQFANGKITGLGHFYNDDGDHFEGQFKDGVKSGFGTYWYEPDNPLFKYTGRWQNDEMDGPGSLYYRNGDIVKGVFKQGVLESTLDEPSQGARSVPRNVLITNDDGVEDMDRLLCLAEEVSTFADKVVIAVSAQNQSGTSNKMAFMSQGFLNTTCLQADTVRHIYVYEVDGYPADCVMLAALGIFQQDDEEIDLVISGINGGANEGAAWFGSGTIGAARTAAIANIPAIAVSGINEDSPNPQGLQAICQWVAELAQSDIVGRIKPFEYLTVSIPDDLESIRGYKILERTITFQKPPFYLDNSDHTDPQAGATHTWKLTPTDQSAVYDMAEEHDVAFFYQNYVVIVPMTVDENNRQALSDYQALLGSVPAIRLE